MLHQDDACRQSVGQVREKFAHRIRTADGGAQNHHMFDAGTGIGLCALILVAHLGRHRLGHGLQGRHAEQFVADVFAYVARVRLEIVDGVDQLQAEIAVIVILVRIRCRFCRGLLLGSGIGLGPRADGSSVRSHGFVVIDQCPLRYVRQR